MEDVKQNGGAQPKKRAPHPAVMAVAAVVVAAIVGLGVWQFAKAQPEEPAKPQIGYATEGVTALDEESLQDAVNELMEKTAEGYVTLNYKNDAFSEDGKTFACYLGNATENSYDMFIGLYADIEFTDALFVSELLRPGTGFETVTLNRALEKGDHTIYLVFTQVEEDLTTIHAQVPVTVNFHVT